MANEFYIGKRLSYDGQLCTLRYYGEVKGTKGEWLGVEWDDPARGKHSGEHGGIRYFECLSKLPTAGSFVRPTRKADPQRSFVEALKAKYASEDFEDPDVEIVFVTQEKKKNAAPRAPIRFSGKEAEEVGFDKIRKQLANLHELRIVILDGLCMSRSIARSKESQLESDATSWPTDLTDVKDACPKTIELDLSRNLFEDWREVASICEQLGKLRSLRVDGNRFRDTALTDTERQGCLKAFANITTLKLENTLLTWEELTNITALFPDLTTFVASSNLYNTLTPRTLTRTITDLSLEDNAFLTLSDLHPLTKLPKLQRLILKANKLCTITHSDQSTPIFSPTVSEVDLSYNDISTWRFIDTLPTAFPGLTSLRVSHNPLYTSLQAADGRALSAEDGYMLTIARLGRLKVLNYSPISEKERLNAESYYLSLIAKELNFASEEAAEGILRSHPRWKWLCEEYGEPDVKREVNRVNPNSLAARLIKLHLYLGETAKAAASSDAPERFETELPMNFTVYSVLGVVGKKIGIPPMKCRLVWETGDWMPVARDDAIDEDWDTDSSDEEDEGKEVGERVMREVEIVPGTRSIGTSVDGMEVAVRIEHR
ncbi:tubulin-specific chaperone-like protein E [Lophiotrema nucula]|uniref:Tubulin-specific chaperone-like protein E n=1 Tax=Lophiotrema nucula TaxID=690887 RepID=A0A6A5ZNG8_9PLEO|nr:tubulin-specific chaperone-like protein E [Lophiotrema nucula]